MVDPSEALLRSLPRDDEQVFLWAHNGWVIAVDNVSSIQHWLSDVICRLSTGGGYSVRRKYTAEDETIFSDQRPVILNGIGDIATKGDLLDRAIVLTLKKIADEGRLTEDEVMAKAEAACQGRWVRCLTWLPQSFASYRLPAQRVYRAWQTVLDG